MKKGELTLVKTISVFSVLLLIFENTCGFSSSRFSKTSVVSNPGVIRAGKYRSISVTMSSEMPSVRFVTNRMCPFAQRTWIALMEAEVPYEMVEISLYGAGGKPSWFLRLNPKGEVPVLESGDGEVVVGSEATLDFAERVSEQGLLPPEVSELVSSWRQRTNQELLPIGKRAVLNGQRSELENLLQDFNDQAVGPFLTGEKLTLADISMFPMMYRIESEFGFSETCPRLRTWFDSMMALPSVQSSCQRNWWWWW